MEFLYNPLLLSPTGGCYVEEKMLRLPPGFFFKPPSVVAEERASQCHAAHHVRGDPESEIGQLAASMVHGIEWLRPHYVDEDGKLLISIQMYIIETPAGVRIAVDTCMGNDKTREGRPFGHMLRTSFIEDLRLAGLPAESINFVLCTHLHFDHVGWNTILCDGSWIPTFPNAKYLFPAKEWHHWSKEVMLPGYERDKAVFLDSVQPIVDAGLHKLVDCSHVIVDEYACKIRLIPTEGHTPGHVSVVIESEGRVGIITGDCIHHPAQLAHPMLGTYFDSNSPEAAATREKFLTAAVEQRSLLIGTHFAQPSAGYVDVDTTPETGRSYVWHPHQADSADPAVKRRCYDVKVPS